MYPTALLVQGKFLNLADLNARVRRVFSGKSVRLDVGALSMWWHESQGEIKGGGGGGGEGRLILSQTQWTHYPTADKCHQLPAARGSLLSVG